MVKIHSNQINNRTSQLLIQHRSKLLEIWQQQIFLSNKNLYKDDIVKKNDLFFEVFIGYINGTTTDKEMDMFTKKIAYERMLSGVNIGEFVHNANRARSVIHEYFLVLEEKESVNELIVKINEFFDKCIYKTVAEYSNLIFKRLERKEQFIEESHKDRLTILGQMSANFVHEFRNPLTSIMGFIKLLQVEHQELPYLHIIEHELEQLNFRISQFLLASKKDEDTIPALFSLKDLLDELIEFLYPSILSSDVEIVQDIAPVNIYAFRTELKQVFLNILINSLDALKEVEHKRIVSIIVSKGNGNINICIQNNGPAIPLEKQEIIFEPFVTTKVFGTGIGLFVCKEIIEKHNGTISCISDEEKTQFCITLPTLTKD
ncbi:MAG: histidine kinase N-terminal domain-containing protein [Bacillaceae bacterium]